MALLKDALAAQLLASRGNLNNNPAQAGQEVATAIGTYWTTGLGPGGAAVPGVLVVPLITPDAVSAFSTFAAATINAKKLAKGIDTGAKSLILVGGIYGGHISISTPGADALAQALQSAWESHPETPVIAARKEANAIHNYTTALNASGTGIPPNIPPQQGPIT